ncbi:MAG: methyltransferase domain-containing protein [Chloroflexota bacterium]
MISFWILALFACLVGAKHVYAIERSDAIVLARQLAEANGFADQITFIQGDIHQITLPEKVDVITSELISKAVLGQKMAQTIGLCRERWLKPEGRIVPELVDLYVAPVQAASFYQQLAFPNQSTFGLDFSAATHFAYHNLASLKISPESLLTKGQTAFTYDAYQATLDDRIRTTLSFDVQTSGTLHGYGAWFRSTLYDDIRLANDPPGLPA